MIIIKDITLQTNLFAISDYAEGEDEASKIRMLFKTQNMIDRDVWRMTRESVNSHFSRLASVINQILQVPAVTTQVSSPGKHSLPSSEYCTKDGSLQGQQACHADELLEDWIRSCFKGCR